MIYPKVNKTNLAVCLMLLFLTACSPTSDKEISENAAHQSSQSGFVHAVYFYLHDSLDQQTKDDFLLVLDTLATIPSLKDIHYGKPANTPRRVVDNTYDYAFICVFENKEDHDAYQSHPIHTAFKERYTPLIEDVKIYDNVFGEAEGYE